jgi:hypothetical protein
MRGQHRPGKQGAWVILLLPSSRIPRMLFSQITLMTELRSVAFLPEHMRRDTAREFSCAALRAWFLGRLASLIRIASAELSLVAFPSSYRPDG